MGAGADRARPDRGDLGRHRDDRDREPYGRGRAQHIPAAWTFRHTRLGPRDYGPMSVAAGNSSWPIATAVAAVQLGTSRRALDAAAEFVRAKRERQRNAPLIENAHVQRQLMRAEGAWSAAYAGVEQALIAIVARCRDEPTAANRNPNRAVDRQRPRVDIGDRNHRGPSARSSARPSRLPAEFSAACLRDAHTIGSHVGVGGHKLELAARMRFGLLEDSFDLTPLRAGRVSQRTLIGRRGWIRSPSGHRGARELRLQRPDQTLRQEDDEHDQQRAVDDVVPSDRAGAEEDAQRSRPAGW